MRRGLRRPAGSGVMIVAAVLVIGLVAPAPAAAGSVSGSVYFLLQDNGSEASPGPYLVPVARVIDATIPATTAMRSLLEGPGSGEGGMSSAVPPGTVLRSVSIAGGVATVDLSGAFASGGGSLSMMARLAQVVFTLTQFPTVDGVRFRIDGVPTTVFGGEGIIVPVPATRADFEGLAPSILLETPAYGGRIGNPARLVGTANTFEAVFRVAIVDGDGRILANEVVMASSGSGTRGTFDVTVPYDLPADGRGSVITWYDSPRGGARTDIREYPVLLTAGAWCRGVRATVLGTAGDDDLVGTGRDDVIVGFGGNDRIRAFGGDDLVCAGPGRDRVFGGDGADRLFGQGGRDTLSGGPGADRLDGGPGLDRADGGPGADRCTAEVKVGCP